MQCSAGAIILATADTGFGDAVGPGRTVPSLAEAGGEQLVARVVRAVRSIPELRRVVVVAAPQDDTFGADCRLEASGSLAQDMAAGLAAVGDCQAAIFMPGNIPFVTGEEIGAFADAAATRGAQVAYPMVRRAACEAAFPGFRRTYFRLAEGELTGGNALFFDVPTFLARGEVIDEAVRLRREPWRLALLVDPRVLLSMSRGGLSLEYIEAAAGQALGISAATIVLDAPGLATDIARPNDLKAAREKLAAC